MHGAQRREVRHHNSLAALRLLERAGSILPAERDVLDEAMLISRLDSEAERAEVQENKNMARADGVKTLLALLVGNFATRG